MACGSAALLGWRVEEKDIQPHVPVWDKSQRPDETFSSSEFRWDEKADEYCCPQGHILRKQRRPFKRPRTFITKDNTIEYRDRQSDCIGYPLKSRCHPNAPVRTIARSVHEHARDVAHRLAASPAYRRSRRDRKKVEILFAHLMRIMKLDRLRLRGPTGARAEFLVAAIAQNLRRMARKVCPPLPSPQFAVI